MAAQLSTVRNAVRKALRVRPEVIRVEPARECGFDLWEVQSSRHPERTYRVHVRAGLLACTCRGYAERQGCYHIAAVAIAENLLTPAQVADLASEKRAA